MNYVFYVLFFFNDTATTEIYTYLHTLSLHDALPILREPHRREYRLLRFHRAWPRAGGGRPSLYVRRRPASPGDPDRKQGGRHQRQRPTVHQIGRAHV